MNIDKRSTHKLYYNSVIHCESSLFRNYNHDIHYKYNLLCIYSVEIYKNILLVLNKGSVDMSRTKTIISLIINSVIFLTTTGIVISYFCGNTGTLIEYGYESFKFFTTDSNVIAAVASLIMAICDIKILSGKNNHIPPWVILFKYIGTVSVMLTFMTVVCYLAPIYGPATVLSGTSFHMHASAPLLCFISFCFIETDSTLSFKSTFIALIPMLLYSVFYTSSVVFFKTITDFYSLNAGGFWYISSPIILFGTYTIAFLTRLLHNKFCK